jgi:hypothetical protein
VSFFSHCVRAGIRSLECSGYLQGHLSVCREESHLVLVWGITTWKRPLEGIDHVWCPSSVSSGKSMRHVPGSQAACYLQARDAGWFLVFVN